MPDPDQDKNPQTYVNDDESSSSSPESSGYQFFEANYTDLKYDFGNTITSPADVGGTALQPLPKTTTLVPPQKETFVKIKDQDRQVTGKNRDTAAAAPKQNTEVAPPKRQTIPIHVTQVLISPPPMARAFDGLSIGDSTTMREIKKQGGATLAYPLWQLNPARVHYVDGTTIECTYDASGFLSSIRERTEILWSRSGQPDQLGFAKWCSSTGLIESLNLNVLPDGTYQRTDSSGCTQTFFTDGKKTLSYAFPPGFNLKVTLAKIFKGIDKNRDTTLTKTEINAAALRNWQSQDEAQLVAMLKLHFEHILLMRDDPLLRMAGGLSFEDIIKFDDLQRAHCKQMQDPPAHVIEMLNELFSLVDANQDGMITVAEIQDAIYKGQLAPAQKQLLGWLEQNLARINCFTKDGYIDRSNWIYKRDLVKLYEDLYREEIGCRASTGGWGQEENWKQIRPVERKIYTDPADPISSINLDALRQGSVGDCMFLAALGSIVGVNPLMITYMIKENSDGTFNVTFGGDPNNPVVCGPPSNVDLALYAKGSLHGIWAPLIQKAYAILLARTSEYKTIATEKTDKTRQNLDAFDLLTGQVGRWEYLKQSNVEKLRNQLNDSFKQRRAVVATTLGFGGERKVGNLMVIVNHAYSVIGWKPESNEVVLRNPWGTIYRTPASDVVGATPEPDDSTNGIFTLNLEHFLSAFQVIYFEEWR